MPETPFYFLLAQLNLLLTSHLRLGFVFLFLALGSALWQQYRANTSSLQGLDHYWLAWSSGCVAIAGGSTLALHRMLPSINGFLQESTYNSLGLCAAILCAWAGQIFGVKGYRSARTVSHTLAFLVSSYCLYAYSFSRSNKDLFALILALPVALALSYFPLCFLKRPPAKKFHFIFLLGLFPVFGVYYGWMYPLTRHIPSVGEFYPFINLYDWILPLFVLLYLGNVYIDFWLNERKSTLALIWNYPVVVTAILCQWLNSNILDTLAL